MTKASGIGEKRREKVNDGGLLLLCRDINRPNKDIIMIYNK